MNLGLGANVLSLSLLDECFPPFLFCFLFGVLVFVVCISGYWSGRQSPLEVGAGFLPSSMAFGRAGRLFSSAWLTDMA